MLSQSCIRPPVFRFQYSGRRTAYLCPQTESTCGFWRRPRPRLGPDGTSNPARTTSDCSLQRAYTGSLCRSPGQCTGDAAPGHTLWQCSRRAYTGKCSASTGQSRVSAKRAQFYNVREKCTYIIKCYCTRKGSMNYIILYVDNTHLSSETLITPFSPGISMAAFTSSLLPSSLLSNSGFLDVLKRSLLVR